MAFKLEGVSVWSKKRQDEGYSGRDGWAGISRYGTLTGQREYGGRFAVLDGERKEIYLCDESADGSLSYRDWHGEEHRFSDPANADVIIID